MHRLRFDFMHGTLSSSASDSTTTLSSAEFSSLPEVVGGSGKIIAVTLGPSGAREIVHITAHDAAATTVTVLRGREGTAAVAHDSAVEWVHAPTAADFEIPPEPPAPASPSAYDDEFDGSSSVVWLDTPTAATVKDIDSFSPGCLYLKGDGTGNNMIGVVQAAPGSFPYTITSRIVGRGAPVNYHRHGGIILCNGLTSGSTVCYAGQIWESAELHRAVRQTLGGSWLGGTAGTQGRESAKFIRVTVDSASSASAFYSDDGYVWVWYNTFNPGFTPTHFGLGCSQENNWSFPIEATFGFFRVEQ